MIGRSRQVEKVLASLRRQRVVGILGARQVGKTTLAGMVARRMSGPVSRFDLEDPADIARLSDPGLALRDLRGLIVLDEIQRRPDLFPILRVLADRPGRPARFLVLGSASPDLLRQSSESLAGRIVYHELGGLSLDEVGAQRAHRLWLRGRFPRSFLARTDEESREWRESFIRDFLERDIPQLAGQIAPATLGRFWAMLAHYHGQVWNSSELARSFGVADTTVRRYLDLLCATFMARQLAPFHENLAKRQVRSPKVYLTDSGIFHALLGLWTRRDLERHPKLGASWEGFALEMVLHLRGAGPRESFFWATQGGAELDLLIVRGNRREGYEFKRTEAPAVTRSMRTAIEDLKLDRLDVIHAGKDSFPLDRRIRAVALSRMVEDLGAVPARGRRRPPPIRPQTGPGPESTPSR